VAFLAAHQDAAHRAGVADTDCASPANLLRRRQVRQVRPVAFASVDHQAAGVAPRRKQRPVRFDRATKLRDVVAEHFAQAASLQEVALHVDDQQRRCRQVQAVIIRFRLDQHAAST